MTLPLFPDRTPVVHRGLDEGREPLDAYYTPFRAARACCAALREVGVAPVASVLEPAAGGGAWVDAAREVWPDVWVTAIDIDPAAAGLRNADVSQVGDFLTSRWVETGEYDLVLGNRPYHDELGDWVERGLRLAPAVAFLERGTILGSVERSAWWQTCPPSDVWVLAPRPRWEGPGAREASDTVDSVLVLWRRGMTATRLRWLRWGSRCV